MKYIVNIRKNILLLAGILSVMVISSCKDDLNILYKSDVTAEFSAETTDIFSGETVTYTDLSEGEVTYWSWTFEGGTPDKSTQQNPTVTYSKAGSFQVRLVVSNAVKTSVVTKEDFVVVTAAPMPVTAGFTASAVSVIAGNSITFTDASEGEPTQWSWEFIPASGTTITSTDQNPVITFDTPGLYSVKLVAANTRYSDEELKTDYINIIDPSEVSADFSADYAMIYAGQTVNFTDMSVGTVTNWEWTFEGGSPSTSTDQNPTVTYSTTGKYKVTLTVSNSEKSSTKEVEKYIFAIPSDGLLAFLPFDGAATDKGPLGLTVTNYASVTFDGTDRNASLNSTAVFDGTGVVSMPADSRKQFTSSFSVGIWMKTDNADERWLWTEGRQDVIFTWFRINNNTTTRIFSFNSQKTSGIINVTSDEDTPLSDGTWHYVVCVRDAAAGSALLYVDGVLIKTKVIVNEDLTNDYGFLVGGKNNGPDDITNMFIGQLDDLVIYNRVLTQDEINMLSDIQ